MANTPLEYWEQTKREEEEEKKKKKKLLANFKMLTPHLQFMKKKF